MVKFSEVWLRDHIALKVQGSANAQRLILRTGPARGDAGNCTSLYADTDPALGLTLYVTSATGQSARIPWHFVRQWTIAEPAAKRTRE
jgi:hypothetical protein